MVWKEELEECLNINPDWGKLYRTNDPVSPTNINYDGTKRAVHGYSLYSSFYLHVCLKFPIMIED